MNPRRSLLLGTAASGVAAALGSPSLAQPRPAPRPFAFALIGDLPYSDADESNLSALLAATDAESLAFVLHVGDLKGGQESCGDALLARRQALLARSAHPLVLLPGDNEWTDCHRRAAGGFEPQERLAALRARFWSTPEPMGRRGPDAVAAMAFERQRAMPENARWRIGGVYFVAVHVVGSNNGFDEYPGSRAEFAARRDLNRRWLFDALAAALRERADALVIATHGNPEFGAWFAKDGFTEWIEWLQEVAAAFTQPILLLHGDTHRFRVDHPLVDRAGRTVDHFTRIECFGWPFTSSWVRIGYDPAAPERFSITTREVRPTTG